MSASSFSQKLSTTQDVLDFWFGDIERLKDSNEIEKRTKLWFFNVPGSDFESTQLASQDLIEEAVEGGAKWEGTRGLQARIILLDQFSRVVYKGSPKAFENDKVAVGLTTQFLSGGLHKGLSNHELLFVALPLLHSEDLRDQETYYQLMTETSGMEWSLGFAKSHKDVIEQFGRFPHRNAVLGRESTKEELEWLSSDKVPSWAKP
eukprot:CAMPEP_0171452284 /NCGR_PEP_ID=MMETSP0945-20130129/452_1 /TAXON_ID=109269 /ORGANISM="Vaucheria litorea, Strain CCMP2940" /LENGTH=204 /DNA_ID=CAMNT_0011976917 /DNA_START=192 /DNA_END=806 /DNA_ORIENTATION=+